jgi:hypothetical protein
MLAVAGDPVGFEEKVDWAAARFCKAVMVASNWLEDIVGIGRLEGR